MMNAFINTKTNMKKLQYGTSKCFKMHVGRTCIPEVCPDLVIDGWKMKERSEVETQSYITEDEYDGLYDMDTVNHENIWEI